MCGFLGKISKNNFNLDDLEDANLCQVCRGPDQLKKLNSSNFNFFGLKDFYISLIFNRLSIIDLSEEASQPMFNLDQKTLIMFNGEIFNHKKLRSEMEANGIPFFTSHSDSEVVLNALTYYGINYIKNFIGQFSIFFLDLNKRKFYLIRDRLGQKPLFYSLDSKNNFSFSTNLKSLSKLSQNSSINQNSLNEYFQLGVVTAPNTIFNNIFKLKPAEYLEIELDSFMLKKSSYWDIEEFVDEKKFNYSDFIDIFEDAVNIRLESDVPLASYLSGGLDSTSIVKAISKNNKVNTYSMIFDNHKYNEEKWSDIVSEKYQSHHSKDFLPSKFGLNEVFEVIEKIDEPYSDTSLIPTYFLSNSISKDFKVAISGDGGDELLFGYEHSNLSLQNSFRFNLNKITESVYNLYPANFGSGNKLLSRNTKIHISYPSYFEDNKLLKLLKIENLSNFHKKFLDYDVLDYKKIMLADYKFYLSEMMLLKIDRASMANSLEVRSPFVDHRLIQYMLSVNFLHQIIDGKKSILKNYLKNDFDQSFLERDKMGFSFDIENWIYSNINLIKSILKNNDNYIYDSNSIVKKLSLNQSRINSYRIWKLLLLEIYINGK